MLPGALPRRKPLFVSVFIFLSKAVALSFIGFYADSG